MKNDNLKYFPEGGAICAVNGSGRKNRPLYMKDGIVDLIYTGDVAGLTCSTGETLRLGLVGNGASKWTDEFGECRVEHRPNRTKWLISDDAFGGAEFTIEAVPAHEGYGFTISVVTAGADAGLSLIFLLYGIKNISEYRLNGGFFKSVAYDPDFQPDDLREASDGNAVCCVLPLERGRRAVAGVQLKSGEGGDTLSSEQLLSLGADRCLELDSRISAATPEPFFDAALPFSASALDGIYVADPPIFYHGGTGWRVTFLGWRTMPGFTLLGWHEKVQKSVLYYLGLQYKENKGSDAPVTTDDDRIRRSRQTLESRLFGKGHIPHGQCKDQMYNMQTQFFDAAIDEWRATGDRDFEAALLPGLELHLERSKVCFDPDDDGLYESYVNVLPTDSMQYNGGGTVEESSYIRRARIAAAEMCGRKGDTERMKLHLAEADKIYKALNEILFMSDKGYFASWIEQNPPHRIHPDAWLYSEFLPIHHGVIEGHKAVSTLFYTEWGLERVKFPFGGEMCWNSNWVPQKWSTRWLYGADDYSLAEAYFRTGLGDDGWELIKGNLLQSNYCMADGPDSLAPGGFSFGNGEENAPCVDAADITNAFVPAVVSGLFGYRPDHPNGTVIVAPAFPSDWDHAAINTADFKLDFKQTEKYDLYEIRLKKAAKIAVNLQVRANFIKNVYVNDEIVNDVEIEPWYDCSVLKTETGCLDHATIKIEISERYRLPKIALRECNIGDELTFPGIEPDDPQACLESHSASDDGMLHAKAGAKNGYFTVFTKVRTGPRLIYRVNKIHIKDPDADARRKRNSPDKAAAGSLFEHIDITDRFNGSIEDIFKQKYLSPRPDTASTRIGTDGYSNWTYLAWRKYPPEIRFDAPDDKMIETPYGVNFVVGDKAKNIAFTSVWDNWPTTASIAIGQAADVAWLLICGSTNCMQGKIENAGVKCIYTDGACETLSLVHPENFWTLAPTCGVDYDYETAGWPLPAVPPKQVRLGENCRAMVISIRLDPRKKLKNITLECVGEDVIVGVMGITLEKFDTSFNAGGREK